LGLESTERVRAYEDLRARGDALERLGLCNPIHERGNADALAALCLTRCQSTSLLRDLGLDSASQAAHRALLTEFAGLHDATKRGSFEARLEATIAARRFCAGDARIHGFCTEVRRVAKHPHVMEWANEYKTIEGQQSVHDCTPLMRTIMSRGGIPIVISQGRRSLQSSKLQRVGLAKLLSGRALITEAAVNIPGADTLDAAVARMVDERIRSTCASDDAELRFLWYYDCLIDSWGCKSPAFFGRCLHAIRQAPDSPEPALSEPQFVSADVWGRQPLHFVMVGDRYDQDVEPLIDLLGPGVALKIRLRCGKYGHLHPEDELPPERRPDMTFTDWDSLATFLTEDLSRDQVNPITTPPDIVNRAHVRPDYIKRGLESPYEAVRTVATLVTEMMR
jgi:hypothetical protein